MLGVGLVASQAQLVLAVAASAVDTPGPGKQEHMLIAKTCLYYLLVKLYLPWFLKAALSAADAELALRVVSKCVGIAAHRQEAGEVLTCEDVLGVIARRSFVTKPMRSVDPIHVGFSLHECRAVLSRGGLPVAALAVDVGAPGEDLTILGQYQAVILPRSDLLNL